MTIGKLKTTVRQAAYSLGLMGLIHRIRNRHTLTVFMFHRVLPKDSVAYLHAEKEFTFTVEGFERVLDFIAKHYTVVTHSDIKAAVEGRAKLPVTAALITFDDGWRDTLLHARASLMRRGMMAVLFAATEAPALRADRWWQDQVVEVQCDDEKWRSVQDSLHFDPDTTACGQMATKVTVALSRLVDEDRHRLLDAVASATSMPRQMLTECDLPQLAPVISLAGHGHSHAPLSSHPDALLELTLSHEQLKKWGGDSWSMSFPHGAYNQQCLEWARQAGFQVCFTSDPVLMGTRTPGGLSRRIGRIHLPENQWTCEAGRVSHAKLATFLFLRAHSS